MNKIIRPLSLIVALLLLGIIFISCDTKTPVTDKTIIAVTIVPQATFARAVCKELAHIVTLVPPGSNPENYEPSPSLMQDFEKASLYFSIGVPTEEANILPSVSDNTKVISLHDEVSMKYADRNFESGERDPHIWLSPKRAVVMVEVIAREMSKLDPENADAYNKNAADYIAKLQELDETISTVLAKVQNKKFIVYHPSFGYLAEDYDLTMYSLEKDGKEATMKHLQDMIDLARAEDIKVIFYQEEIDSSQSKTFAQDIGGVTMQLSPLAADYIESLKSMTELIAQVMS